MHADNNKSLYAPGKGRFTNSIQVANSCSLLNIEENRTPITTLKIHFVTITIRINKKNW